MTDFFCHVVEGEIQAYNLPKPKAWGNTSFGANATDDDYRAVGLWPIVGEAPAYDSATKRLEGPVYATNTAKLVVERTYLVVPYVPPVPQIVTMRQARLALFQAGLLDQVDAIIDAMTDPIQQKAARIEWEYSQEVHRNKALVKTLAPALGLDDAGTDQLFIAAATL